MSKFGYQQIVEARQMMFPEAELLALLHLLGESTGMPLRFPRLDVLFVVAPQLQGNMQCPRSANWWTYCKASWDHCMLEGFEVHQKPSTLDVGLYGDKEDWEVNEDGTPVDNWRQEYEKFFSIPGIVWASCCQRVQLDFQDCRIWRLWLSVVLMSWLAKRVPLATDIVLHQ